VSKLYRGLESSDAIASIAAFEDVLCLSVGAGLGSTGTHNITCIDRVTGLPTFRVGVASASVVKGALQFSTEQEGVSASSVPIYQPSGLTFDNEGNLYFTQQSGSHNIRMVKRWW